MPNPGGINNFNKFAPEPQYGEKIQQDTLERAAPIGNPPNVAKQAQRRAVSGGGQSQGAVPAAPAPQVAPEQTARQAWGAVAAIPELSPLAKSLIARLT